MLKGYYKIQVSKDVTCFHIVFLPFWTVYICGMGCVKVVFIAHLQDEPVDIEAAKKRPRPEWQLDCRNPRKSW